MQRFRSRPLVVRVLKNSAWLSADRVIRLTVGLFVGVWLARYLGPATFGLYSLAFALVGLFGVFSRLGLDGVLVREIVRRPDARGELLGSALALRLSGGTLAAAAATLCAALVRPDDTTVQFIAAIVALGLIFQAFDVLELWFQSQMLSRYAVLAKTGVFLLLAAVKVLLILSGAPVTAFAWAALAEVVLASAGLVAAYRLSGQTFAHWRVALRPALELLRPAAPLILAGIAVSVYMKIDQVMIATMIGDEAVGLYAAATRLTEATYFVPTVLMASLLPAIVSIRASSEAHFRSRMQNLFDLMVIAALVLAVPLSLLSGIVIRLLYGAAYEPSAQVLAIHVWVNVFVFLGVASSSYLLAENLTAISFYRTLLGAIANIVLNLVMIPRFGIVGAAWATLVSAFIATFAVMLHPRSRPGGMMMLRALVPVRMLTAGRGE